jgi:hypothetical protein
MKIILELIGNIASIVSGFAAAIAVLAAGIWFFRTAKSKRRVQIDIECSFFFLPSNTNTVIAEVKFIFVNKGYVEHRLYDLYLSIHRLGNEYTLSEKPDTKELEFSRGLLEKTKLVPNEKFRWYFVRPGVRQVITHIVKLESPGPFVRITASFNYDTRKRHLPHTARRLFKVEESRE